MARTRVVATLGPASRDEATIKALATAGVDVFRLNFSHGTQAEHAATIATVRRVTEGRHTAILQDLGGPKLRLKTPVRGNGSRLARSTLDAPRSRTPSFGDFARHSSFRWARTTIR